MSPRTATPTSVNKNELRPEDFATAYEYETERTRRELEQRIVMQLPKDNENYKDPVSVCINGKITVIERGVAVPIPKGVVDVLSQSTHQMLMADKAANAANSVNMGDR